MAKQKTVQPKDPIQDAPTPEEERLFTSLRAQTWKEFQGQESVKETLRIAIAAAKKRKESLEHIL
ncbi:MAG: Holliday junction branch migration DNA helicase RuvB, partial [Patescibacteria group bacterium]